MGRSQVMKKALIISAVLLAGCVAAHAGTVTESYRDLSGPPAPPRAPAASQAALDYCHGQTGDIRGLADTPAFKQCMLGQGYRGQRTIVKGKPAPLNGVDE